MRMMTVLVLVLLCLSFGCTTDESGPLPDDTPAEELGQVEQALGGPCRANYMCPLGEYCDFSRPYGNMWTCMPYAVWGPSINPCLDDLQCQYQYTWYSYCYFSGATTYGECVAY
jgi:hypothetical protein